MLQAIADMNRILGDRQVAVARELTKIHEGIFRGSLSDARGHYSINAPRGEFTIVVAGKARTRERWSDDRVRFEIQEYLANGESPSNIASTLANESGIPRRDLYNLIINLKQDG